MIPCSTNDPNIQKQAFKSMLSAEDHIRLHEKILKEIGRTKNLQDILERRSYISLLFSYKTIKELEQEYKKQIENARAHLLKCSETEGMKYRHTILKKLKDDHNIIGFGEETSNQEIEAVFELIQKKKSVVPEGFFINSLEKITPYIHFYRYKKPQNLEEFIEIISGWEKLAIMFQNTIQRFNYSAEVKSENSEKNLEEFNNFYEEKISSILIEVHINFYQLQKKFIIPKEYQEYFNKLNTFFAFYNPQNNYLEKKEYTYRGRYGGIHNSSQVFSLDSDNKIIKQPLSELQESTPKEKLEQIISKSLNYIWHDGQVYSIKGLERQIGVTQSEEEARRMYEKVTEGKRYIQDISQILYGRVVKNRQEIARNLGVGYTIFKEKEINCSMNELRRFCKNLSKASDNLLKEIVKDIESQKGDRFAPYDISRDIIDLNVNQNDDDLLKAVCESLEEFFPGNLETLFNSYKDGNIRFVDSGNISNSYIVPFLNPKHISSITIGRNRSARDINTTLHEFGHHIQLKQAIKSMMEKEIPTLSNYYFTSFEILEIGSHTAELLCMESISKKIFSKEEQRIAFKKQTLARMMFILKIASTSFHYEYEVYNKQNTTQKQREEIYLNAHKSTWGENIIDYNKWGNHLKTNIQSPQLFTDFMKIFSYIPAIVASLDIFRKHKFSQDKQNIIERYQEGIKHHGSISLQEFYQKIGSNFLPDKEYLEKLFEDIRKIYIGLKNN